MMKKIILTIVFGALLAASGLARAAVESGAPAPDFTLTDSTGAEHSLSDFKGKYVVLEWVNYECPFVKKHYQSGNMQSLQKKHTEQGVVWLSVNSSAPGKQGHYPPEEINEIMENADVAATAYLIDEDGKVGNTYSAKTTPHMYVIDPEGTLIYQGAIDSIASFDPSDIVKADNYVDAALASAMEGEPVNTASTQAYGCSVKY